MATGFTFLSRRFPTEATMFWRVDPSLVCCPGTILPGALKDPLPNLNVIYFGG